MILASASPRRRELLEGMGIDVRVVPADIDESRRAGEVPRDLVLRLACAKAHAAYGGLAGAERTELVLAADTIVWDADGAVFGKPADRDDAQRMLQRLSGATHHVSTGVCLLLTDHEDVLHEASFVETTDVSFHELDDAEIAAYLDSGEPFDKAGAYGIQGIGRLLVRKVDGDYPNVVGLPVNRTLREAVRLLRQVGGMEGTLRSLLAGKGDQFEVRG